MDRLYGVYATGGLNDSSSIPVKILHANLARAAKFVKRET
jgi:hypothetical protein